MRKQIRNILSVLMLLVLSVSLAVAQTPAVKSVLGTVTMLAPGGKDITVKPDNAAPVTVKLLATTAVQRIPPGETSLKNAATIKLSDVSVGDRVLVSLAPNATDVLRILVMSATDIAKRDQADRLDWNKRGVSGIVSAKSGDQITLKMKGPQGDISQVIVISDKTKIKKYAADSVKFADAKPSKLDEVSIGDQVRARGDKTPDGQKIAAEDVVFGTFLTMAGSVVAVDPAAKSITVRELGTSKSVIVKLAADSTIKQMSGGAAPTAGAPAGAAAPGFAGAPNVAQMIDSMPLAKLEDVKVGASVVISSSKGGQNDQVTAILLITNADALIKIATTPNGRGGTVTFGSGGGGGGGLDVTGLP